MAGGKHGPYKCRPAMPSEISKGSSRSKAMRLIHFDVISFCRYAR